MSLLVVVLLVVAGCTGGQGVDSATPGLTGTPQVDPGAGVSNAIDELSAQDALTQARDALVLARSYRVSGSPTEGAPLNLVLVRGEGESVEELTGRGSRGTVSQDGATFRLLAVDGSVYVRGNLSWLSDEVAEDAERTLGNKWLLLPESLADDLSTFTDPAAFADAVLLPAGPVQPVGASVIDGTPAVGVRFVDTEATVWISGVGEPYPLLVERLGATATDGVLRFSDFDVPVELEAPRAANVVVAPEPSEG